MRRMIGSTLGVCALGWGIAALAQEKQVKFPNRAFVDVTTSVTEVAVFDELPPPGPPPPPPIGPAVGGGQVTIRRRVNGQIVTEVRPLPPPAAPLDVPIRIVMPNVRLQVNRQESMANQMLSQFRSVLHEEYLFARQVCQLNPDERKEIAVEGERALRTAVDEYVEFRMNPPRRGSETIVQPRKRIQEGLCQALQRHLPSARAEVYSRAVEQRMAARRRAIAEFWTAQYDRELLLTSRQREDIVQVLNTQLKIVLGRSVDPLGSFNSFTNPVSADTIEPFLNETQRELLRSRSHLRMIRQGVGVNGQLQQVRVWGPANQSGWGLSGDPPALNDAIVVEELVQAEEAERKRDREPGKVSEPKPKVREEPR